MAVQAHPPASDLVETIVAAAVAAIQNQRPALTSDAGYVKSVNLELELTRAGQVVDSTCWLECRGVHQRRATTLPSVPRDQDLGKL